MVALRVQGKALRSIAAALAAQGHRISHESVGRPSGRKQLTLRSWRPASGGPCVEVIVRLAAS
jgi:hypothetical protein